MKNGFLGYNASFMLDFVVSALVLIVPVLIWSIWLVKYRQSFLLHKRVQIALSAVLLLAVVAFEVDTQLVHGGWQAIINKPDQPPLRTETQLVEISGVLRIHLIFAISTPVLWAITLGLALRRFPEPPTPGQHSRLHKTLGWISTVDLTMTAVTGLWFYYVAFVA
ncbi:DUF420 domain-containing protein [Thalassoroseus pseudoceratinae]|uniref:DUF420 domain-containing protein n=1 Tax=Thalassoroseus pseudoceratinae TaxID=2713176 RepID=UPI0014243E07|nr:DUF420 domain-containing protein [Thalassoroseus pseudoceratinae]